MLLLLTYLLRKSANLDWAKWRLRWVWAFKSVTSLGSICEPLQGVKIPSGNGGSSPSFFAPVLVQVR